MQMCTECESMEQGTITVKLDDGEKIKVCAVCQMEDGMKTYDEDYGRER